MRKVFRSGVFVLAMCFSSAIWAQQPIISSAIPMASVPGFVVTIAGTGINPVAANNVVYFGATRANVTAAGVGFATVTVPDGATHANVSLTNTASGLTGWTQYPFLPTFNSTPYVADVVNFDASVDFSAGGSPSGVAIGDIDGDGKPDIVAINQSDNTLSVFRNTASTDAIDATSFAAKEDFMTSNAPVGVVVADFDGDGKLDVAVANQASNTVSVYHNNSTAGLIDASSLAPRVDFATAGSPGGIAACDIDGDGKPEIVVTATTDDVVSVLHNTTTVGVINTGSFSFHEDYATGAGPNAVATADIDGDGKQDILVGNTTDNTLSVLRNTSTTGIIDAATFSGGVDFATGTGPSGVAVADLDGDGKIDVVVANNGSDNVSILRNTATSGAITTGSLDTKFDFAVGSSPNAVGVGDMDGDSRPDISVPNMADGTVSVLRNAGFSGSLTTASFDSEVSFAQNSSPVAIVIGDLDGDHEPEIICADAAADVISVLKNNPLSPIEGTGVACLGATDTLTDATGTGVWSSASTVIATVGSSTGVVVGVSVGTVEITYSVPGGFTTKIVTVNGLPDAGDVSGVASICAGANVAFATTGTGGVWSSSNTAVATVDASGVVTGIASGSAAISYTLTTGCGEDWDTSVININPLADAGTISGESGVCLGSATNLSSSTPDGVWSSSDGGVATIDVIGNVSGVATGSAIMSYIHTNSCGSDTVTYAMTVNPLPMAITGTDSMCEGASVTLANATSGGTWNSPDMIVSVDASTGVVNGLSAGTASVSYSLPVTGCSATVVVTVNAQPSAIGGLHHVCEGSTRLLTNSLSGGVWSGTDASTATVDGATGVVSGVASGTLVVSYEMPTGCYVVADVTVNPTPGPIVGDTVICQGFRDTLYNASPGGVWSSSFYARVPIDAGTGAIYGSFLGPSIISYTTTGGCSSVKTVTVLASPVPVSGTGVVCEGLTTSVASSSFGGAWVSSDTSVAVVVVPTGIIGGVSAGTAEVSYVATNGCYRSIVVTVNPSPDTISGEDAVCTGDTITLGCATVGGTWSSGHAFADIAATSGLLTGVASGLATVSYTLPTGCQTTHIVSVNETPASITGMDSVCEGLTTILSTTTAPGLWSSEDATVATIVPVAGLVTGISAGTTNITFTVPGSGCFTNHVITVNALPDAISGSGTVCEGSITTLASTGTPDGTWSSSDIATAIADLTTGNVLGVLAGTVNITYRLPTGCMTSRVMTVAPLPVAGTLSGPDTVCEGASVMLSASLPGGTWSISSGHASVSTTGDVTGVSGGSDIITYSIVNSCGTAVVSHELTVNPLPAIGTFTGDNNICLGKTRFFSNSLSGGAWSSSDPSVATVASGTVSGVALGTATISYTRTNACGSTFSSTTVTVHALVDPGVLTGTDTICIGDVVTISASVSGGTWSSASAWVASVSVDGDVTGHYPGGTIIRYIVANSCSSDTATLLFTVRSPVDCYTSVSGVENTKVGLSIYPNPTNGAFSISAPVDGILSVLTVDGRVVAHYNVTNGETNLTISENLSAGVYICRFEGKDGSTEMLKLLFKP